ncbi:MAG: S58 family peptidase, partial [Gammaproteobacteria bacterium]|nr:S58 family peptidase [Gammaproteobacteria bacterium]
MKFRTRKAATAALTLSLTAICLPAAFAENTRARDLGISFEGQPGALNAITDVPGVEVGQVTLVEGDGPLEVGEGPVRT